MASLAEDPAQIERYRTAAQAIRTYIESDCRIRTGAYAAHAGTDAVDTSAAPFPVFGYTSAADPTMDMTIHELERRYCVDGTLYHRHLESRRAERREGAFLAGTFGVAHYWIARGHLDRGRRIIDGGLSRASDLGLFSEEIHGALGVMRGNFSLGLVHAGFLAATAVYPAALPD